MRHILVVMLFAVSAFAQPEPHSVVAACGPVKANLDVTLDQSPPTPGQAESGKALVYFIQDMGLVKCLGHCGTTKIGLDGAWVGAVQHNSYFSVSVEPGEHHVCADPSRARQVVAFAHFTAEAGKTYYFRDRRFGGQYQELFDLDAIDSDQGQYLIASDPMSVSRTKP